MVQGGTRRRNEEYGGKGRGTLILVRVQDHGQGPGLAYFSSFSSTNKSREFQPKGGSSREAAVGLTPTSTRPGESSRGLKSRPGGCGLL